MTISDVRNLVKQCCYIDNGQQCLRSLDTKLHEAIHLESSHRSQASNVLKFTQKPPRVSTF